MKNFISDLAYSIGLAMLSAASMVVVLFLICSIVPVIQIVFGIDA